MSEKVMEEALAEIADLEESRWVPNHCVNEQLKVCGESVDHPAQRRIRKLVGMTNKPLVKRIVLPPPVAVDSPVKKRGRKPGSRVLIVADVALLRWSFRQLSMSQDTAIKGSTDKRQRHHPKQTENKTPKRRGRKPRRLQQERMALVENSTPGNTVRRGKRKRLSTKDKHLYEYAGDHMRKRRDEKPEIIWKWCSCSTLDVSFPDNEVMDICSSELEEEMPSLCQDNVIQSNTPDKSCIRAQDGSINATFSETCENPLIESHGLQSPPEVTNAILEDYFIKVDRDLVQYLHSYCIIHKEPVSKYSRFSAGVPKELLRSQGMSWSKSSELGQECTGDVQEAIPPQPPSGPGIVSPDGIEICNPGVALEAPEGDVQTTNVTNLPASARCLPGTNFPGINDLSSFTTTLPSSHTPNCIESRTTLTSDPERNRVLATLPSHMNSTESGRASSNLMAGSSFRIDQLSLVLHCGLCNKDFKGGNIMRHAFAHLLRDKQRCMFCGKQFECPMTAKSHVAGHIEELRAQIGFKYAINPLSRTSEALERGLTPLSPGDGLKSELHCKSDDKVLLKSPSLNCTVKDSKSQEKVSVAENDKAAIEKFNGAVLTGSAQGGQEEEVSLVDQCASSRGAVAPVIRSEVELQPRDACIEAYGAGCKEGKMMLSVTASEKVYANGHSENRMAIQTVSTHGESRAVSPSEEFTKVSWVDRFTVGVADSLEEIGDADTKAKDQLVGVGLFRRSCIPLPPSAYLDERYTSMPKRRKPTPINHDLPTPQRCPSCFSSFSSEEELQRHRSLDSCASLFGFDSDDEGKSDWA
ncbi:hypothetical protein GJAV_G00258170 [Gymnothorax javanicus]|nr:hypothetical protein GJAV_G00258170 [Gymnothorax javanicus]